MAIAGAIVGALGALASMASSIIGAKTEERFAKAEAKSIGLAGKSQERRERRANERILAKQRAIGAASGVVSSEGSSLTQLLESTKEGKLNELVIRQNAEQARQNKLAEARAARGKIGPAILTGVLGAASSVIGGFMGGKAPAAVTPGSASSLRNVSSTGSGFRRGFGVRRPRRIGI